MRPFVAFEFGCSEHSGNPDELFVMKPAAQCEYHLCHRCLAGLVALASECLPAELMATATVAVSWVNQRRDHLV
jgi:hypothetical protein